MVMSAKHRSKFAAVHRNGDISVLSEKFSSGTETEDRNSVIIPNLSDNKVIFFISITIFHGIIVEVYTIRFTPLRSKALYTNI